MVETLAWRNKDARSSEGDERLEIPRLKLGGLDDCLVEEPPPKGGGIGLFETVEGRSVFPG